MDRRFFENDNIEDLTKNEGPENFQKIDEEEEVLKENYIWSDQEDEFSPAEILDKNDGYPIVEQEESFKEDIQGYISEDIQVTDDIEIVENIEVTDEIETVDNIEVTDEIETTEEETIIEIKYESENEYSDFENNTDPDCDSECDYDCNYGYSESEEDTNSQYNCEFSYSYSDPDKKYSSEEPSSSEGNESSTLEEKQLYREYKRYYLRGRKDGYNDGYEDGARDAIKAAYRAGYKCGLRAARYRN